MSLSFVGSLTNPMEVANSDIKLVMVVGPALGSARNPEPVDEHT
jgi:hypothetical protein